MRRLKRTRQGRDSQGFSCVVPMSFAANRHERLVMVVGMTYLREEYLDTSNVNHLVALECTVPRLRRTTKNANEYSNSPRD